MTRILIFFSVFALLVLILNTEANDVKNNNSSFTESDLNISDLLNNDGDKKISRRYSQHNVIHLDYGGKSNNFKRNRPARRKRPRKNKPRLPFNPIDHETIQSVDFDESDYMKQLQDERRNRFNKQKEQLKHYDEYYASYPGVSNTGHAFDEDEIKDLFLSTNYDYNKFVRDYNAKVQEFSGTRKMKRPLRYGGKYTKDVFNDSEGVYDFSETSNPDLTDPEKFYKQLSKYKKNDATQQISPLTQYELEKIKDYGVRQNSYGKYVNLNHFQDSDEQSTNTYPSEMTDEDAHTILKQYGDINYRIVNKSVENDPMYTNHNYAVNYAKDYYNNFGILRNKNNSQNNYQTESVSNVNSPFNNINNEFTNYDSKTIHDYLPTKYSISEWNNNINKGSSLTTVDNSFLGHNIDVVKQFYEMNNLQSPTLNPGGVTVTSKPLSYDQQYAATMGYEWPQYGNDEGWKVIDTGNPSGTQLPMNTPHTIIIPVPQPYPVRVPIAKPVAIPVLKEIKVPVEKEVPYPVIKNVPYPVEKPVPVKVEKQVTIAVPKPYPVKVPIVKNVYHHTKATLPHDEEWGLESGQEYGQDTWDGADQEMSYEESVHKELQRHPWWNGRPKDKSKRKNNYSEIEDYEIDYFTNRQNKRNPANLVRQNGRNKGSVRDYGRRKKNSSRPRVKTIRITKRISDD